MTIRCYTELNKLKTFLERYNYLRLNSVIGESTFGFDRYINQRFYTSRKWTRIRDIVILRDNGCDLGLSGNEIFGKIFIHHMNPISLEELEQENPKILEPEFLITVSHTTHLAIHYGDQNLLPVLPNDRKPGDTCLWN